MSSRTGQRGTSVATSQRKYRSRSAPRYDMEKKAKKKDLRTSGTNSLVSIPNSMKLIMLNSGLISFAEGHEYAAQCPVPHTATPRPVNLKWCSAQRLVRSSEPPRYVITTIPLHLTRILVSLRVHRLLAFLN
ncbi:hypothetical protein RR46_07772 [Papilio xuthus]|uniref:Uncharacterized protein n=1 Tax=Papilio xuthus TaxID=66420 RepID=A0A194QEP7_PAPXU|nr:hypothetical protein RR46_07772 [Papilio xuthus]